MAVYKMPKPAVQKTPEPVTSKNSQWSPILDLGKSPAVVATATALASLPPVTPWTAGLKLLGVGLTTALVGDLIVDGLSNFAKPKSVTGSSTPQSAYSPSGGVDHVSNAQDVGKINQSKIVPPPIPSSTGSLLDVLSRGSANTNKTISNSTEVMGSHFSFLNEQFGAHLLYMDILVTTLDQISTSLQVLASASIDSVNKTSATGSASVDYSAHLEKMAQYAESAKIRQDFLMNEQTFTDLEGNPITTAHPEQIKAQAMANQTQFHSDTNNDSYDDMDFPLLDTLPIIPFVGVSDSFDKTIDLSTNPFIHKMV